MMTRLGMVLALMLAFSVVEPSQVQAQCGIQGACGYGWGFDVGRLYGVLGQNVPHFAAFPPVYYSAPVPRTYGYSPFAYPPGTMTPELPAPTVAAKEILNPYVPASTEAKQEQTEADRVTHAASGSQPLAIFNPYVQAQVAEVEGPQLHGVVLNR